MTTFLVALLKPFALALVLLIALPFKRAAERLPDGKLKRILLLRLPE